MLCNVIFPWYPMTMKWYSPDIPVMVENEWKRDNRNIVEVYVRHRYSKLEVFPRHAIRSSLALAHRHDATLSDLLLHLHTDMTPRYQIFSCTCTRHDATLSDLLLHLHTDMMPRYQIFSCTCTPTWCHAIRSSLALAHRHDATLSDLLLHLHTDMMPRYQIFSCTCTPTWRHAIRSSLALAHRHDATLWDLLLHLHTDMMPRYEIFSRTCTPTWCHAIRSSPGSRLGCGGGEWV